MRTLVSLLWLSWVATTAFSAQPLIEGISSTGTLTVQNPVLGSILTLETSSLDRSGWTALQSQFGTNATVTFHPSLTAKSQLFRVALNDVTSIEGPWTLQPEDIADLPSLVTRMWPVETSDALAGTYRDQLSSATINLFATYSGAADPSLQQSIVSDWNAAFAKRVLYDPDTFATTPLTPSTQALLDQNPTGADIVRLNRLLIEDAFPSLVVQRRAVGFTNLVHSFGLIRTVAGSGNITCAACNSWNDGYEGGLATDAALSSPHIAMADRQGNIYIADKRAHAIRKVLLDGTLITVAGTGVGGLGDTNPAPAITLQLNNPNGIWVREDGSFYILDRDNGLIRKVDTDGIMSVVVDHGSAIPGGRGLWVSGDETVIFYAAGSTLMRWDSTNGLASFATGFQQLGNIATDPAGNMVVTDSDQSLVFRLEADGSRTVIAGNGFSSGGGDGYLATQTGLSAVRAICFLPNGSFFVGTDAGGQVWYVDTDSHIHLFLNGNSAGAHDGDGSWFFDNPQSLKVGAVKQITLDYEGNLLITESTEGYVRKISFLPPQP